MNKNQTVKKRSPLEGEKVCFVISPIGKEGTNIYKAFKEVYDYVIKPAVKNSDYDLRVIRADDIERSGSFIKDILEIILDSHVVIADLTNQNPNVFYELGVRHCLSPRTILIAQSLDDIPSDLREYRTIIYDLSAKGAKAFSDRLSNYLEEIFEDPQRPDNPVLDRLGSIIDRRTSELVKEATDLKAQLSSVLKKGRAKEVSVGAEHVRDRLARIFKLNNAVKQVEYSLTDDGTFTSGIGEEKLKYHMPVDRGNFELHFLKAKEGIRDSLYVSAVERNLRMDKEMADVRVLMEDCSQGQNMPCNFIIATNEDLTSERERVLEAFAKMKTFVKPEAQTLFNLEIWDSDALTEKEKELGIRVEI